MRGPWSQARPIFLGKEFWLARLEKMRSQPRLLTQLQRKDLARPGVEVLELNLKSHDGTPITALFARSKFHRLGHAVHLRLCGGLETCAIDWKAVNKGIGDLVFPFPAGRCLEERVLDVLRMAQVAADLEAIEIQEVELYPGSRTPPDEFVIADWVLQEGWE